jgi:HK97 family phage prohead protease
MKLEHKTIVLHDCKFDDAGNGTLSGYGSVFGNKDLGGDIVVAGAFARSLPTFVKSGFISWSHQWETPVATIETASEDTHGLSFTAEFHSTPQAQEKRQITAERLARGKSMGLSIGYSIAEGGAERKSGARYLKDLNVYEIALCTVPMNQDALVGDVKSEKIESGANPSCPFCEAGGAASAADCTCTNDCGFADCPGGAPGKSAAHKDAGVPHVGMGWGNPFAGSLPGSYEALQEDLGEAAATLLGAWLFGPLAGAVEPFAITDDTAICVIGTFDAEVLLFVAPDSWGDADDGFYLRVPYTQEPGQEPVLGIPALQRPAFLPATAVGTMSARLEAASRTAAWAVTRIHAKEGRVLSGANLGHLQSAFDHLSTASDHLQTVMAAAPAAPSAPVDTSDPSAPTAPLPSSVTTPGIQLASADERAWGESMRALHRTLGVPV